MSTVISADGTTIDYDAYGNGPTVIFIGGATQHRAIDQRTTEIAKQLAAEGFTAVDYDRRGRDRSGDTPPWSLDREVEDVAGEHRVMFLGARERIELAHAALDRSLFAEGALVAARWVVGQPPGRYSLLQVLGF